MSAHVAQLDTCPTCSGESRVGQGGEQRFLKQNMKYFIYILKSINYDKTYIGITNNLERRLKEHNAGKSIYTRRFKPWEIVYTEELPDRTAARKKEKYFKSSTGRKKVKLILNNNNAHVAQLDRATVS